LRNANFGKNSSELETRCKNPKVCFLPSEAFSIALLKYVAVKGSITER